MEDPQSFQLRPRLVGGPPATAPPDHTHRMAGGQTVADYRMTLRPPTVNGAGHTSQYALVMPPSASTSWADPLPNSDCWKWPTQLGRVPGTLG